MSTPSPIAHPVAYPLYQDLRMFTRPFGFMQAWEFNGWKQESMSWKTGCYIHAGLSGPSQMTFTGPEAGEFVSSICINGFSSFQDGGSKHAVMLTDNGLIASHSLLQRDAEDRFRMFAAPPWAIYQASKSPFDVQFTVDEIYLLQVAGPTSLQTLEHATDEDLRDVGFLRFRPTTVAGKPTEICRIGMSGTLAYELRGPIADGPEIYDAVVRAGADFGIERLGWRTYMVNHVEGGFPQLAWTFMFAAYEDPGYAEFAGTGDAPIISGSIDPADMRARYRTPVELDWHRAARFDHEFLGRKQLEAEVSDPKRTIVTLRWNPEDVIDIYASLLRPGEEYKTLDLPTHPYHRGAHAHADHVLKDGKPVGISSGTVYSYYYREVISHCTIDIALAHVGTEVIVKWGDFGGKIKDVRATVARFPYLDLEPNQSYDLSRVPSGLARTGSAVGQGL
jgi:glycine cleavage system aminomethyltransferase T